MPKSTTFAGDIIGLLFNGTTITGLAINATASPLSAVYLSLHTADPGVGGSQTTNETAYTNYLRVAVSRVASGWTVTTNQATNTNLIQFPRCGITGATITHVAIGTDYSGAGKIMYSGALNDPIDVANLITPQFSASALVVQES